MSKETQEKQMDPSHVPQTMEKNKNTPFHPIRGFFPDFFGAEIQTSNVEISTWAPRTKTGPTFHESSWLVLFGILTMVYYNPQTTG